MKSSAIERRISVVAAAVGVLGRLSHLDEAYIASLSRPCVVDVVLREACDKAQRRWLAEHNRSAGVPTLGGGWYQTRGHGWIWFTTQEERELLSKREIRELLLRAEIVPFFDAVEVWISEAAHWPPLGIEHLNWGFREKLSLERERMEMHRAATSALTAEWRRRTPEWTKGMDSERYDEWELALLASTGLEAWEE